MQVLPWLILRFLYCFGEGLIRSGISWAHTFGPVYFGIKVRTFLCHFAYLICLGSSVLFSQLKKIQSQDSPVSTGWASTFLHRIGLSTPYLYPDSSRHWPDLFYRECLQAKIAAVVDHFSPIDFAWGPFTKVSQYMCGPFFSNLIQQDRINVWLRPENATRAICIMWCNPSLQSAQVIYRKRFLGSTLTKLNYVPEQSTDFIFSIVGEEQGFLGS